MALLLPPSSLGISSTQTTAVVCSSVSQPQLRRSQLRPPLLFLRSSFFDWESRSHLGSPALLQSVLSAAKEWKIVSKRKCQGVVQASLFGVGAPEALVIGVVALLVFGPRGLAEVARTLGKSLRSFQPTIRELQQISREFKDTLEQEIGLDELRSTASGATTKSSPPQSSVGKSESMQQSTVSADQYVRVTEEQAKALVPEEQRKAAEAAAWGGAPPSTTAQSEEKIPGNLQADDRIPSTAEFDKQVPATPLEVQTGGQTKSSEETNKTPTT